MTAVSPRSVQPTFWDTPSVISSPGSASGPTPSVVRDGLAIALSGPPPVPASPSLPPDWEKLKATSGISGPLSGAWWTGSPASSALQSSLESRLRARLDGCGSPLFALTWKNWAMPLPGSISALRASVRRTSAKESTGWPTPTKSDSNGPGKHGTGGMDLRTVAQLATGWPTPRAEDSESTGAHHGRPDTLTSAARLTPQMVGVAQPTTRDHKDGEYQANVPENSLLGRQAWQASGPLATGSPAPITKRGQLNPAHSRWLMGLPSSWDRVSPGKARTGSASSAATATRSTPSRRSRSSSPTSTSDDK